jgi:multiple sugar transport system permease protein
MIYVECPRILHPRAFSSQRRPKLERKGSKSEAYCAGKWGIIQSIVLETKMLNTGNLLNRENFVGYLFCIPIFIIIVILILYPFLNAGYMSLTQKMVGYAAKFVGLRNYIDLFNSQRFHQVFFNSIVYTSLACLFKLILGMVMAIVLNEIVRGRQFFRGFLLLTWITPDVVNAITWRWLFDLHRGLFNNFLLDVGLIEKPIHWLGNPKLAMACVITANVWRGFPFFGMALLAAMQTVPKALYEAAEVDGASPLHKFIHITVPEISNVILICLLLSIIWTLNDFNIVYLMTKGGPGSATHIFATYSYELGIESLRWGIAISVSMYSVPILILLIITIHKYLHREV